MKNLKQIIGIFLMVISVFQFASCGNNCSHVWGEWILDKSPGIAIDGEKHRICVNCQSQMSESIPATGSEGLFYSINSDLQTYSVAGIAYASATDIFIPQKYLSCPVTAIGNAAFCNLYQLKNVTISKNITSIGNQSFKGCANMTNISIPSSVTNIGDSAFEDCKGLTSVTLLDGITIGSRAFAGCKGLTSIVLPENIILDKSAFVGCTNIKTITVGYQINDVRWGSIFSSFTEAIIKDGVEIVEKKAFSSCNKLQKVTLPSSVKVIEKDAFSSCQNLTDIYFKGTKAQWETMQRDSTWDRYTSNYTVHCTDGDIAK